MQLPCPLVSQYLCAVGNDLYVVGYGVRGYRSSSPFCSRWLLLVISSSIYSIPDFVKVYNSRAAVNRWRWAIELTWPIAEHLADRLCTIHPQPPVAIVGDVKVGGDDSDGHGGADAIVRDIDLPYGRTGDKEVGRQSLRLTAYTLIARLGAKDSNLYIRSQSPLSYH